MQNETKTESIQDGIETEAVDRHDFSTSVRNHFEAALAAGYVDATELVVLGIRHGTDYASIMEAISGYAYASRHTMPTEALHKTYAATRDAVYREDHARREAARVAKQDESEELRTKGQTLTELETKAYASAILSSEGNGHDFGFTEDVVADLGKEGISAQAVGALLSSLSKKGLMDIDDAVETNPGEFWTQIVLPEYYEG